MKEALFYEKIPRKKVLCRLCHWNCKILPGKTGVCGVRKNKEGTLYSLSYGRPCSIAVDPVEKKPLFHFLPGERVLSIGTLGCNFFCQGCQNFEISRADYSRNHLEFVPPEKVVSICREKNCKIIAFTYNEPTMFFEYMLEIARLAKKNSIKTVMVSNGYASLDALKVLAKYLDAANIDLKGFSEKFYKEYCKARLASVLENLKFLKDHCWLELTNLLIPGMNDDDAMIQDMCAWIKQKLGDVPLHFSRFFPLHKAQDKETTSLQALENAKKIAEKSLSFVYLGNTREQSDENTVCPSCKKVVVKRRFYTVFENNIRNGKCIFCSSQVRGVWD